MSAISNDALFDDLSIVEVYHWVHTLLQGLREECVLSGKGAHYVGNCVSWVCEVGGIGCFVVVRGAMLEVDLLLAVREDVLHGFK